MKEGLSIWGGNIFYFYSILPNFHFTSILSCNTLKKNKKKNTKKNQKRYGVLLRVGWGRKTQLDITTLIVFKLKKDKAGIEKKKRDTKTSSVFVTLPKTLLFVLIDISASKSCMSPLGEIVSFLSEEIYQDL